MAEFFDVVFIADPRFSGGTSTALETEMRAAVRSGLSVALLPVMGPVLRRPWPVHPGVAGAMADCGIPVIGRGVSVRASFAIVHHPSLFEGLPVRGLGVMAETVILVLHHPPFDGQGAAQYPVRQIVEHIEAALGQRPLLAPVGPRVREQIPQEGWHGARLLPEDWHNLIDLDGWPQRPDRPVAAPIRIGRHSRPLPQKWPATLEKALAAYPARPDFEIVMLGGEAPRLRRSLGEVPAHWHLIPFGEIDVPAFLTSLDFYVYFHAPAWIEAFGRAILEAAACGLVVILDRRFEALFGPAAIYAREEEVAELIDELTADPARYRLQGRRARAHVARRFGPERFRQRLEAIRPDWAALAGARPAAAPATLTRPASTALFMTSNGVGLGHLTRALAIADHMPAELEPVFFTLSQAADLVRQAGYRVEYRPFHRSTGADLAAWNAALTEELSDVIAFYGAQVLIFDGNVPYQGLCDALGVWPDLVSIWMRRAFWAETHEGALSRAGFFDAIIEPRDLAEVLDHGPTVDQREAVHRVPPIIRGAPGARLERRGARRVLGLPEDKTLALVSLGPQSNFDLSAIHAAVLGWAEGREDVVLVHLVPWFGDAPELPEGALTLARYPIFPYSRAFDFQISTCGYNAFHEAMLGAIPTVFVPNEAGEMDLQLERARFGTLAGASLLLRRHEVLAAGRVLDRIADPATRTEMRAAAGRLVAEDGAVAAARFISDYAGLRKLVVP